MIHKYNVYFCLISCYFNISNSSNYPHYHFRSDLDAFWLGIVKPDGIAEWFGHDNCQPLFYIKNRLPTPSSGVKCLKINASIPVVESQYESIHCSLALPYICKKFIAKYEGKRSGGHQIIGRTQLSDVALYCAL